MKTLLFLLFPIVVFSQTTFKKLDSLSFMRQVDAVIQSTGKVYNFQKKGEEQGVKYLIYIYPQSSEDRIVLTYYTMMEGEDKNLEITGTKKWNFSSIKANYLTLFPVWKMYVEPSADKEKLAKSGYKMKSNFSINEITAPVWLMRF